MNEEIESAIGSITRCFQLRSIHSTFFNFYTSFSELKQKMFLFFFASVLSSIELIYSLKTM